MLWVSIVFMPIRIRLSLLLLIRIRIRILLDVLYVLENLKIFFYFCSRQCQFTLFYLSRQRHRCHNFRYSGQGIWKISSKKYSGALHLVEMHNGCGSTKMIPVRHDPDPHHCSYSLSYLDSNLVAGGRMWTFTWTI